VWRNAEPTDDPAIVRMGLALYAEDPGPELVPAEHTERTLAAFRREPWRGRALVLELEGRVCGYALLASFWSNEMGGEACVLDEIYVEPGQRGRGRATRLLEDLLSGASPHAHSAVALALEVTPANQRARRLYERLGFRAKNLTMNRRLPRRP
jgi:GNAT superfamily N-acetyltransferase